MAIEAIAKAAAFREVQKPEAKAKAQRPVEAIQAVEPKQTKNVQAETAGNGQENLEQENGQASQQHIRNVINEANVKMKNAKTKCEFSYHEATKRVSIKIVDQDTDEVVREVPPEETLKMIEKIWELTGIMVDEKR